MPGIHAFSGPVFSRLSVLLGDNQPPDSFRPAMSQTGAAIRIIKSGIG
jgi:hypothetical protein